MAGSEEPYFHKQTSECNFIGKIAFVISEVKFGKPYLFDIVFEDSIVDFSKTLKCQWQFGVESSNEYATVCFFLRDEDICDLEATIDMEIVDKSYNNIPTRYHSVMKLNDRDSLNFSVREERQITLKNVGKNRQIKASIRMTVRIAPQKALIFTQVLEKKWQRKKLGMYTKDFVKITTCDNGETKEIGEISKEVLCRISNVFQTMIRRLVF